LSVQSQDIFALKTGYVDNINSEGLGRAVLELGGGRENIGDKIDKSAGLKFSLKIGSFVRKGDKIATIYSSTEKSFITASNLVDGSYSVTDKAPKASKLILAHITNEFKVKMF